MPRAHHHSEQIEARAIARRQSLMNKRQAEQRRLPGG
jgi:hypothetical protein